MRRFKGLLLSEASLTFCLISYLSAFSEFPFHILPGVSVSSVYIRMRQGAPVSGHLGPWSHWAAKGLITARFTSPDRLSCRLSHYLDGSSFLLTILDSGETYVGSKLHTDCRGFSSHCTLWLPRSPCPMLALTLSFYQRKRCLLNIVSQGCLAILAYFLINRLCISCYTDD